MGEVVEVVEEGGRVVGVRLKDGREMRAELVVLATGAWTPGLVDLGGRSVATGQALGYFPLSKEEYESIKDAPVVFNLSTGTTSHVPGAWVRVRGRTCSSGNLRRTAGDLQNPRPPPSPCLDHAILTIGEKKKIWTINQRGTEKMGNPTVPAELD